MPPLVQCKENVIAHFRYARFFATVFYALLNSSLLYLTQLQLPLQPTTVVTVIVLVGCIIIFVIVVVDANVAIGSVLFCFVLSHQFIQRNTTHLFPLPQYFPDFSLSSRNCDTDKHMKSLNCVRFAVR